MWGRSTDSPLGAERATAERDRREVEPAAPGLDEIDEHAIFLDKHGKVLLCQQGKGRREGMWRLPLRGESAASLPLMHWRKYGITRYRVTLWVHAAPSSRVRKALLEKESARVIPHDDLANLPMPSPYRRALNALLADAAFRLEA